ncbi:MAG: nucleoside-diphosphate kinase [Pseudomonadota bacterium]
MEKTMVIIKPDAMERKLIGQIISAYEKKGLYIKAIKIIKPTVGLAEEHYAEHREKPFFREVVDSISRSEVCVILIEGDNAISQVRSVNGATDPRAAEPGTIRALFGVSKTENTVHASDSAESAEREIKLWFPEL